MPNLSNQKSKSMQESHELMIGIVAVGMVLFLALMLKYVQMQASFQYSYLPEHYTVCVVLHNTYGQTFKNNQVGRYWLESTFMVAKQSFFCYIIWAKMSAK